MSEYLYAVRSGARWWLGSARGWSDHADKPALFHLRAAAASVAKVLSEPDRPARVVRLRVEEVPRDE